MGRYNTARSGNAGALLPGAALHPQTPHTLPRLTPSGATNFANALAIWPHAGANQPHPTRHHG
eukprot:10291383-Lingulodinium_polyedra.AAC.1